MDSEDNKTKRQRVVWTGDERGSNRYPVIIECIEDNDEFRTGNIQDGNTPTSNIGFIGSRGNSTNIGFIWNEENNISKALRGLLVSISTNYQTSIIRTQDYEDTAKYLITLAKQQIKPKTEISLHSRIPKTKKEQKSYILESFPNIGPTKAKQLLKKFKTVQQTINATEEELEEILKSKTKDFKDLTIY